MLHNLKNLVIVGECQFGLPDDQGTFKPEMLNESPQNSSRINTYKDNFYSFEGMNYNTFTAIREQPQSMPFIMTLNCSQ